ncbi:MAG: C1 family peptidase, partial [Candidatus Enteromonas sp.]
MAQTITPEDLALFEAEEHKPGVGIARRAVESNGLVHSATDVKKMNANPFVFNLVVEAGDVCNQKRSGRCWMFAGLNVIRVILAEKLNVKSIELSQSYLQFYDKLEKANFFLEKGLERSDKPLNDPEMVYLFDKAVADGGHFAMFKNL